MLPGILYEAEVTSIPNSVVGSVEVIKNDMAQLIAGEGEAALEALKGN